MDFAAHFRRWLPPLLLILFCAAARAQQSTSVSINMTDFIIQGELNQFRTSIPFEIVGAPAYVYTITGFAHGEGPVYSQLVPTSEPVSTALDAISPGLSSVLQGSVSNPGAQLPTSVLDDQVSSGTNGVFNATFSLSLDASGEVDFSITNVAIATNGQPDTTDRLVFDSGVVDVTALFADVSVDTHPATNLTASGATLQSSINCPNNFNAYFVYSTNLQFSGSNPQLTGTTGVVSLEASGSSQSVSIPVTGLLPHQLYYYKAVGADITGPSYGGVQTFRTLDVPPVAANVTAYAGLAPTVIPVLASATNPEKVALKVTAVGASIAGVTSITSGGKAISYQFTTTAEPQAHFAYTIADDYGGTAYGNVNVINYAPLAGNYSAVLLNSALNDAAVGVLRIALAGTGQFSGLLIFGGVTVPVTGSLNSNGEGTVTLKSSGVGPLTITLDLEQGGNGYSLNANVDMNAVALEASLPPAAAGLAGSYTLLIPPPAGATYQGSGYALVKIGPTGLTSIAGALPDGTAFSCSSVTDSAGQAYVYSLLYGTSNPGSIAGTLSVNTPGNAQISGTLVWRKPGFSSVPIDQGPFAMTLTGSGGSYAPRVGTAAVQFGTLGNIGQVVIAGGNLLAPIEHGLAINSQSLVTVLGPGNQGLELNIQTATGLFTGSFRDPLTLKLRTIHGALLQGSGVGGGYFLGTSAGGAVSIGP